MVMKLTYCGCEGHERGWWSQSLT